MSSDYTKVTKSEAAWRQQLTEDQFRITRQHGTERPFTGPYLDEKKPGTYACVCCGNPLFNAETKYNSGSGWPSFFAPMEKGAIAEHQDHSLAMRRIEARCARCDAHLGHIFNDGPQPTGLRYCINGTALTFNQSETS